MNMLHMNWFWNWSLEKLPTAQAAQQQFVPMFWSDSYLDRIQAIKQWPWVMLFNEPALHSQANMTLQLCVDHSHWALIKLAARGIKVVSPSFTVYRDHDYGLVEWLDHYYDCWGAFPFVEAVAVHWYGDDVGAFVNQMNAWRAELNARYDWDMPLWLTEFGWSWYSYSETAVICQQYLEAIEQNRLDWSLERWSWFATNSHDYTELSWRYGSLVDGNGNLTPVGEVWANQYGG
jgi:hypothetical protein